MHININIEIDGTETTRQLDAIAAMIASLAGRAPVVPGRTETRAAVAEISTEPLAAFGLPTPAVAPVAAIDPAFAFGSPTTPAADPAAAFGSPTTPAADPAGDDDGDAVELAPGERDANGLPWDERIHAGTKSKNADGSWRNRRNVPEAEYNAIVAELKAGNAPAAAVPPAVHAATESAGAAVTTAVETPPAAIVPPPPPAAIVPPPPAGDAPAALANPFVQLVKDVNARSITYDVLNPIAVSVGVSKFTDLAKRPDLIPGMRALLGLDA
jgi:hypothetical protein